MGQAVGTAAGLAVRKGILPAGLRDHIHELQQILLRDDAYLPWVCQEFSDLPRGSLLESSQGNSAPVRDGINRQVGNNPHCWEWAPGDWIAYRFAEPAHVHTVTLIVDSAMEKLIAMSLLQEDDQLTAVPDVMPRKLTLEVLHRGQWQLLIPVYENNQRLVRIPVDSVCDGVRVILNETWGSPQSRLYAFHLIE
jgi:hypothetical protein